MLRRTVPVLLALALVPATGTAAPSRTADRGGVLVAIDVTLHARTIDVVHAADAMGAPYTVHYWVKGTVTGPGYALTIDDAWTESLGLSSIARPARRQYPVLPDSTVTLAYGASIASPLPSAAGACHGAITRLGSGRPTHVTSC